MKPIRIWDFCLFVFSSLAQIQEGEKLYVLHSDPAFSSCTCQRFDCSPKHSLCWAECYRPSPQLLAQLLKSKESCLFLVVGILLSLVALGFAAMLHGGSRRKMLTASRTSLWDSVNNTCLVVTHKQLLPSRMPKGAEGWEDEGWNEAIAVCAAYQCFRTNSCPRKTMFWRCEQNCCLHVALADL